MEEGGYPDAAVLSRRIGMGLNNPGGQRIWGMADVWPGSVLLPSAASQLALVDWEFPGVHHPGAEVGMLLAHVLVHAAAGRARARPLAEALLAAYTPLFVEGGGEIARAFVREALCAYGREVVVAPAFWGDGLDEGVKAGLVAEGVAVLRAVGEGEDEMRLRGLRAARFLAPLLSLIDP
jgi:hypothetical protein